MNAFALPRKAISVFLFLMPAMTQVHILSNRLPHFLSAAVMQSFEKKNDVFNILWVLVFGFATLNILGLVARRFESNRNRFSFGEALAVMVVAVSVVLLGWEMLTVFHIFPIKLHPN